MQSKKWILSVCNEKQIKAATEEEETEKKISVDVTEQVFLGRGGGWRRGTLRSLVIEEMGLFFNGRRVP